MLNKIFTIIHRLPWIHLIVFIIIVLVVKYVVTILPVNEVYSKQLPTLLDLLTNSSPYKLSYMLFILMITSIAINRMLLAARFSKNKSTYQYGIALVALFTTVLIILMYIGYIEIHVYQLYPISLFVGAVLYFLSPKKYEFNTYDYALDILWLIGIILMFYIIYNLTAYSHDLSGKQEYYKGLLTALAPIGIILASFIASASVLKSIEANRELKDEEHNNKNSEFSLNKLIDGLETVYNLLKDRNNNREIWIEASRALLNILELEKSVTNEVHKKILDIKLMEYRHKLYKVITVENTRAPLRPSFFYGVSNWKTKDIEDAYNEAEGYTSAASKVEDFVNNQHPKLSTLYPKSIKVIFDFVEFPSNYSDYLQEKDDLTKKSEDEINSWERGGTFKEGAANFFKHLKHKSTPGK